MALRNAKPITWRPTGVCDSQDGTNSPPGAMSKLINLIPDPTTRSIFVPRPGAISLNRLASIKNAGQISAMFILGDVVYGLVASSANPGYDQPFAYDLATKTLLTVTGFTPSNVPLTQPIVGDWTPPTMDSLGIKIVVTHPGFTGIANGFFGWFDITNPLAPVWSSGNTSGAVPLPAVPAAVCVYGGRAYYAVGNATVASDALLPLQVTNAGQVLTFGDITPITALFGLPLNNQLGGIIQSLMVFKDSRIIYQLTGDFANMTWAINSLNVAVGTIAPGAIVGTPVGLAFIAPDGLRFIDFNAHIGDPIGHDGEGISVPFQRAVAPTRMTAAFNQNTLRIALRTATTKANYAVEYWLNFGLKAWSGPHSIPSAILRPYKGTFIAAISLPPGGF